MSMLKRLGRLFVIKTRWEAWFVIYAIALGAIERGRHYLLLYPGTYGIILALACTGVVFLAGAKLLDSVRVPAAASSGVNPERQAASWGPRRLMVRRNRPTDRPSRRSEARSARHRKD